jgi:alpha-1,2-mannosyltransferase
MTSPSEPLIPASHHRIGEHSAASEIFRSRRIGQIALGLWIIATIVTSIVVINHPGKGNLCNLFRESSLNWWAGRDLYEDKTIDGFLYFPQFAIVYTPFALLPSLSGDLTWRAVGVVLMLSGMFRLARLLSPHVTLQVFGWGAIAALAPALSSIRCGQANLFIAAALLHAAIDLTTRHWSRTATCLLVALAVKPIIAVTILLVAAVYRPMRWRLVLGILIFAAVPFLLQNPYYVAAQYRLCATKITMAALPNRAFPDFRGLLWTIGWQMPQSMLAAVQVVMAAGTLAICLKAAQRWDGANRALVLTTMSAFYLMLFNPRTESNSYIIMTPILTIPAAALWLDWGRPQAAWAMWAIAICMSCDGWEYHLTHPWLKPAICLLCAILLMRAVSNRATKDYFALADRPLQPN